MKKTASRGYKGLLKIEAQTKKTREANLKSFMSKYGSSNKSPLERAMANKTSQDAVNLAFGGPNLFSRSK